jgi:glycine dehydrogenase subunit 1
VEELASKNRPGDDGSVFLGCGVGFHHIPSAVTAVAGRSEFVTAYTSYQPEISQGMLQTLFEYQSLLAELLEIDVVNSSMYDMGTALGEAARMASRVNKKKPKFLVPGTINTAHYRAMLTLAEPAGIQVERVAFDSKTGLMSLADLSSKIDDQVAGVYVENPSYLGFLETQVDEISRIVHQNDALLVAGVDVLSLGILRPPGQYGADIVIGEGQMLGNPVSYGGPLLGVFGCRNDRKLIYQLPGRLVGMTHTTGEPRDQGFVLTLSPREQHIRREKATSNICSNQALMAVTAAIYLSTLGSQGLCQLGEIIAHKSNYAAHQLNKIKGVTAPAIGKHIWKGFVVRFTDGLRSNDVHEGLLKRGIHGGWILNTEFPSLGESMLFSVTELQSKNVIDDMVQAVRDIAGGE